MADINEIVCEWVEAKSDAIAIELITLLLQKDNLRLPMVSPSIRRTVHTYALFEVLRLMNQPDLPDDGQDEQVLKEYYQFAYDRRVALTRIGEALKNWKPGMPDRTLMN